jgi:hypothetical protein
MGGENVAIGGETGVQVEIGVAVKVEVNSGFAALTLEKHDFPPTMAL